MLSNEIDKNIKVGLIAPAYKGQTSTFIELRKNILPFDVLYIYQNQYRFVSDSGVEDDSLSYYDQLMTFYYHRIRHKKNTYYKQKTLYKILKKIRPDVIYAEFGQMGAIVVDSAIKLKIPLIVNFHGYDIHRNDIVEEHSAQYKKIFKYAHSLVAVSHKMKKRLVDLGADKNEIHVVPSSPNPIFKYIGNPVNPLTFLAVGRFVEKKAPHLTILAFNKALHSNPDLKLRMIGDGPLLNSCKQLIRSLDIRDSVILLGPKDHNEVVKEMTDTGAFLQHSVEAFNGDSEGTPAVLFEAMACGVPVIVTKHAGLLEVVEHGKDGFLVDEFDINSMSDYMLKLSQNSELAHEMGQNGLKKVQEQYNIDLYIKTFHDIITDAIKG